MLEVALIVLAVAMVASAWIVATTRARGTGAPESDLAGAAVVRARIDQAASELSSIRGTLEERRHLEEKSTESVARIERLLAGSYAKGRIGENLLEAVLSEFPADLLERQYRIGGRVCEFALRLSDGKLLPIDSKWPALQGAEGTLDPEAARRSTEKAVLSRIREVGAYIDPALTAPMAVVALPDSIYACCRTAHAEARNHRVVLVPYSSAVPILLSIWNLHRAYGRTLESEMVASRVHEISTLLTEMRDRIEGQLSRGLTQSQNAIAEMRTLVSSATLLVDALSDRPESGKDAVEIAAEAV